MNLIEDEIKYEKISKEFLRKFVLQVVLGLHDQKLVDFNVFDANEDARDLVYTMCFRHLVNLEDFGGFPVDEKIYVPHCMFSTDPRNPKDIVSSNRRTDLHGGLDDGIVNEAFLRAQEEIQYQRMFASGTFVGTGIYADKLKGTFLIEDIDGKMSFKTNDNFFFSGTPSPGFALGNGDLESMSVDMLSKKAEETDFLRLPGSGNASATQIELNGVYSSVIDADIDISQFESVFLWCFQYPVLLGVGKLNFA